MRIVKVLLGALVLAVVVFAAFAYVTRPRAFPAAEIPEHTADVANGERLFNAGGCLSCHGGEGDNAALPVGGKGLKTPAGTFYPPNITPDRATGIGTWSDADFLSAMVHGTTPGGHHLFPSFPYTSYRNVTLADLLDLKAYLFSFEPVSASNRPHDVPLLPAARMAMGGWKLLAGDSLAVAPDPAKGEAWNRGAYLVQGPGHCGECHTPRNLFMVMDTARFLAGGPHPEGKGKVPSLRGLVARGEFQDAADLALALQHGEAFGYDGLSSGGMGDVQKNLAELPETDLQAIATFLVSLE